MKITEYPAKIPASGDKFILASGGQNYQADFDDVGGAILPQGYLFGLTLSNNSSDATNDIDIAAGKARSSDDANSITLASAITKRLDANWVVGTNQGGLDTGSIANATYHVFVIKRSDTGVVDVLFSLSPTAPTMPPSYDYKRRIGSIVRSAGAIKAFVQDGDKFMWKVPVQDVSATNPGTSAVTRTLTVPTGVRMEAILSVGSLNNGGAADNPSAVYISDLSLTDSAANFSGAFVGGFWSDAANNMWAGFGNISVFTNTSSQVRSRIEVSTASSVLRITTLGWVDDRGRSH